MELWHSNFASLDRMPLLRDADANRPLAIWRLAKLQLVGLVLFCIVDDHLHLLLRGSRTYVGRVVARIKSSWSDLFAGSVGGTFHRPVESRRHLLSLIPYFLGQPRIHGLPVAPAKWDGSCFYDLVGARQLPPLKLELQELLPRLSLTTVYQAVDLATPPRPVEAATLLAAGPERLWGASCRAFAVDPSCNDRAWRLITARATAAQLAQQAGIPRAEMGRVRPFAERTWRRLVQRTLPPGALEAARLQLALHMSTAEEEQRAAS